MGDDEEKEDEEEQRRRPGEIRFGGMSFALPPPGEHDGGAGDGNGDNDGDDDGDDDNDDDEEVEGSRQEVYPTVYS